MFPQLLFNCVVSGEHLVSYGRRKWREYIVLFFFFESYFLIEVDEEEEKAEPER